MTVAAEESSAAPRALALAVPPAVTAGVVADDSDERWAELEASALAGVDDGEYLLLTSLGSDGHQPVPRPLVDVWTARLERLLSAGFTLHRRTRGAVSFRRAPTSVLYLAPWLTFGGSDKGTIDWLRHLPGGAFRRYLLTTQPSANELFGTAEQLAEEAWALPDLMPGSAMPGFIINFVATRNIDVVHIMNSRLGFDLLPALKAAYPHLRTVVQLHVEEEDRSGYCRYVTTRYGNLVDAFSVTSEDLRHKLRRYDVAPSRLHVIYTGLEVTKEFDPSLPPASEPLATRAAGLDILFPARLTAQKDPLLMVRVAGLLREAGSSSVIHAVGDGELRAEVQTAVTAAGLQDFVRFHGPSYDMASWYRSTDVTLLTSTFEGMPFVVFEALGMGRPVVVPDLGGTREVVDAEVGYLVQRRDRADDYARALLELERDPEKRAAMGAAARRRIVVHFTVEHMANGHARLYRRLAAEHAAHGLIT